MASRTIPQQEWRAFFDGMAGALVGKRAEVGAASLDVALSGLNHLIGRPREIYVQEGAKGVETVAVVSADGDEADPASEGFDHAARCRAPRR